MEKENNSRESLGFLPFDPLVLLQDVAKRWLLILLVVVLVGTCTYIYSDIRYTPQFKSNATLVATSTSATSTIYSNLTAANSLATVFEELLNSSLLRQEILQATGLESFSGTINARVITETNLVTVTVTDTNPRTAFLVAQALLEHHHLVTSKVVDGISLEVLQQPQVPGAPSNPTDLIDTTRKAMLVAAVSVCALLAVLSYYRDAVRSSKEAKAKLDCSLLGEVAHENKYKTLSARLQHRKTSLLITNPIVSFRFVETVRKLRHRVQQHMRGKKVLMITSLLENEGKSTVAVNLALSMAQKRQRVLLIDCDLRKPACNQILQLQNFELGVKDVLSGWAAPEDAIFADRQSGLHLLLEKRGTKNSGDLLNSEHLEYLLDWARRRYDFIVVDLPPIGEVSDAEGVMEYCDASLLVVRQNTALAPAINKAIAALEGGKAKLLGCVLNNVYSLGLPTGGNGYGYGYGYGYGKYGHYGKYGKYGHYGRYDSDGDDDADTTVE